MNGITLSCAHLDPFNSHSNHKIIPTPSGRIVWCTKCGTLREDSANMNYAIRNLPMYTLGVELVPELKS